MPKPQKLRFQIADASGVYADAWSITADKSEVYVASRSAGGIFKVSLHKSGSCKVKPLKYKGENRDLYTEWWRAATPDKINQPLSGLAMRVAFPSSFLSSRPYQKYKDALDIAKPSPGNATYVALCYTKSSHEEVSAIYGRSVVAYMPLPELEEALAVLCYEDTWVQWLPISDFCTPSDETVAGFAMNVPSDGGHLEAIVMRAKREV